MKVKIYILFSILIVTLDASAQLATDDVNISKARKSLDKSQDCKDALNHLRLVSDSGKLTQTYLVTIGRANDCNSNRDQAILYYSKFMEKEPGNDSLRHRIEELREEQRNTVASQEAQAKKIYSNARKGSTPRVSANTSTIGLSVNFFAGGSVAPFSHAYNFFESWQTLFAKKRLLLEIHDYLGYVTCNHSNWVARAFNTTPANVSKVGGGFQLGIETSLAALMINKRNLAISVGPDLGIRVNLLPPVELANGTNNFDSPLMLCPVIGLRCNLFFSKNIYFYTAYFFSTKTKYKNTLDGSTTITPVNGNYCTLGIGFSNIKIGSTITHTVDSAPVR